MALLEREYFLTRESELRVFIPIDSGAIDALTVSLLSRDALLGSVGGGGDLGRSRQLFESDVDKRWVERAKDEMGQKFNANTCEVNGAELLPNTIYSFGDFGTLTGGTETYSRGFAFYTSTGCTLRVKGPAKILSELYTTDAVVNQRKSILDIHYYLDNLRLETRRSKNKEESGPRVLVLGSECSGKTTLVHSLINYAARGGYQPILMDLSSSLLSREAAELYCIQGPIDPAEGLGMCPKLPFFFGSTDLTQKADSKFTLLKHTFSCMHKKCLSKFGRNNYAREAGFIIDCPAISVDDEKAAEKASTGSKIDPGLDFLYHVIIEANIDVVITCGGDRLRSLLRKHCAVVEFEESGGSMSGPPNRSALQQQQGGGGMFGEPGAAADFLAEMGEAPVAPKVEDRNLYFEKKLLGGQTECKVLGDQTLQMIAVEAASGCTHWFKEERMQLSLAYWKRYFLGSGKTELNSGAVESANPAAANVRLVPHIIDLKLAESGHRFAKLHADSAASRAGWMPLDEEESAASNVVVEWFYETDKYVEELTGRVLMISATFAVKNHVGAWIFDDEQMAKGLGLGYVYVLKVAEDKITVLSPCKDLPNKGEGLGFFMCETKIPKTVLLS